MSQAGKRLLHRPKRSGEAMQETLEAERKERLACEPDNGELARQPD